MFERRVFRGNTSSMSFWRRYCELGEGKAPQLAPAVPAARAVLRPVEVAPTPRPGRVARAIWVEEELIAQTFVEQRAEKGVQGEPLPPRPLPDLSLPQQTGCHVGLQTVEAELFDFERESAPLVALLAERAMEDGLREAELEAGLARCRRTREAAAAAAVAERNAVAAFAAEQRLVIERQTRVRRRLMAEAAGTRAAQEKLLARATARRRVRAAVEAATQRLPGSECWPDADDYYRSEVEAAVQRLVRVRCEAASCGRQLVEAAARAVETLCAIPEPSAVDDRRQRISALRAQVEPGPSEGPHWLCGPHPSPDHQPACHIMLDLPRFLCAALPLLPAADLPPLLEALNQQLAAQGLRPVARGQAGEAWEELWGMAPEGEEGENWPAGYVAEAAEARQLLVDALGLEGPAAEKVAAFAAKNWTVAPPVAAESDFEGLVLPCVPAAREALWGCGLELLSATPLRADPPFRAVHAPATLLVADLSLEGWLADSLLAAAAVPPEALPALSARLAAHSALRLATLVAAQTARLPAFEPFAAL